MATDAKDVALNAPHRDIAAADLSAIPPANARNGHARGACDSRAGEGASGETKRTTRAASRALRRLVPVFVLALFALALWLLHRELRHYRYHDVMGALAAVPRTRLAAAGLLTALSYVLLSGYDALGFVYLRRKLGYARILFTSFIGYVLSYNVGFSALSGTAVRYRLYTWWGLRAGEVAQVVAFTATTFWAGFSALAGALWLFGPVPSWTQRFLPFGATRVIGAVLVASVVVYALACACVRRPFVVRGCEWRLPSLRLALGQMVLGAVDLAVASGILFVLLPVGRVDFATLLGIYLVAMIAGVVSHVPAGIGVFESVVLFALRERIPAVDVLGALLAYRVIYYLAPLGVALAMLAASEAWRGRVAVRSTAVELRRWLERLAPPLLATCVFGGGVMLLFSGATPGVHQRLFSLRHFVPLPLVEISHFASSAIGVGLLFLGRGLQRRSDAAYGLTLVLLAGGVAASLLKGLDYEEAAILALMFVALLPCRRCFHRRASLFAEPFTAGWLVAVGLALAATVWLGLFCYQHVEYTNDLWWHFSFRGNAPRFLRAMVGVLITVLGLALARLLRPAAPRRSQLRDEELAAAAAIAGGSPETHAWLALLGDKSLLFSASGASFLMYAVEGRSWIAMGDPVGDEREFPELVRRLRERADAHGGWAAVYQAGGRHLALYLDFGFALVKIGEEARVPLAGFTLEGSGRKVLRQAVHRAERDGCTFALVPAAEVAGVLPDLRRISDAWLAERNTREKGFSLGRFAEDYVRRFPVAVVRRAGAAVAFANVWCGGQREELSVDLMRFEPDAPPGVMDFLFVELMRWGAAERYAWFNLGMAPLSGIDAPALAPLWNRVGAFVFRHGEHFYNFRGLRSYKEKFAPVWRPRYLATPGKIVLPTVLANVASLIGGGLRGIIAK